MLKRLLDIESKIIHRYIKKYGGNGISVLDVGCGYGRNLHYLSSKNIHAVGVDVNADAVSHNVLNGHECFTTDDPRWKKKYDFILMSHIIEHFSPSDLVDFMEAYLSHLPLGGYLVIATPLLTDYFFDDFTHIKPYPPESLSMIFGDGNRQVSMRSIMKIELRDLWFRTSAYKIRRVRACYLGRFGKLTIRMLNSFLTLLHVMTFGFVGRKDGWVGVFQRVV